jgi:hypothetical protein
VALQHQQHGERGCNNVLVVRGVIMDYVRTDPLFNFVTVDEFIWNEPPPWAVRVIAEDKFTSNHLVDHRLSECLRNICPERKATGPSQSGQVPDAVSATQSPCAIAGSPESRNAIV